MRERIIQLAVPEGTSSVTRRMRDQVKKIVEALDSQGIVNKKEDDLTVNLVPHPLLPRGSLGRKVNVIEVFRDGPKGALDAIEKTYRID